MARIAATAADSFDWFDASQAAHLAKLSRHMVNYLCRSKVVIPTGGGGRRGRTRRYTFGDVVTLRLVAKLSEAGVSPLRLKKGLEGLRKYHPEITLTSLPGSHVVTNGKDLYLRREGQPIERTFDGQFAFAFVVELEPLRREVVRRLPRAAAQVKTMGA
jgi:DNA-binding transcriptional MerR regulator